MYEVSCCFSIYIFLITYFIFGIFFSRIDSQVYFDSEVLSHARRTFFGHHISRSLIFSSVHDRTLFHHLCYQKHLPGNDLWGQKFVFLGQLFALISRISTIVSFFGFVIYLLWEEMSATMLFMQLQLSLYFFCFIFFNQQLSHDVQYFIFCD